jgi:hypothetical protein
MEERTTISNMALLDLTGGGAAEELAAIDGISNVAVIIVPESLSGALARIPMRDVASVVPVPDGADVRIHTGSVVMGGDALGDPDSEDAVLVVTGTLALSSPVERVTYSRVIVTGVVVAPRGSESALAKGLTRVTGSVQYYDHVEGQRFRSFSGQTRVSGELLANRDGNPDDVLFLSGQSIITDRIPAVGFQRVIATGQLIAPRASEAALLPVLSIEGQIAWYDGDPRFFVGTEGFARGFFELFDEPFSLVLVGSFTIGDDVPPELLREKVSHIALIGRLEATPEVVPVLQFLTTEKHGVITVRQADGDDS